MKNHSCESDCEMSVGLRGRWCTFIQGGSRGCVIGAIAIPKTFESSFSYHDFVQFGKQRLRDEVILTSIVLSQQCCEVSFMYLTVVNL